jgi:hypothetical protein
MTKKEAKAITLELWGYLAAHPECESKRDVSDYIYAKIKDSPYKCLLCDLYNKNTAEKRRRFCDGCPLDAAGENCFNSTSAWISWGDTPEGKAGNRLRKRAAVKIVRIVKKWKTGEE